MSRAVTAMRKVYDKLVKLYCTVRIYSVEGNDKRDIADWIDDCQTATEREALRQTIIDEALDPKSRSDAVGAAGKAIEFAEIEPCEEVVDGQELLTDLSDIIKRHMSIFPYQADTVALWIVMAHIHEHFEIETAPFLNITSPTKRAWQNNPIDNHQGIRAPPSLSPYRLQHIRRFFE